MSGVATLPISAINLKLYLTVTHDNIMVSQDHYTNLNLFAGVDENLPDIMGQ